MRPGPPAAVFVVTVAGAWIIVSVVAGFPARWETIFQTVVAALTLAMVFVIQHSQARHQHLSIRRAALDDEATPGPEGAVANGSPEPHRRRPVPRVTDHGAAPWLLGNLVPAQAQQR
jgi:hypothetical protein